MDVALFISFCLPDTSFKPDFYSHLFPFTSGIFALDLYRLVKPIKLGEKKYLLLCSHFEVQVFQLLRNFRSLVNWSFNSDQKLLQNGSPQLYQA